MPDLSRVSSLVQQAMDEFDAPGVTVAGLLRRCQRIASLRGDGIALAWLHLEATDVTNELQGAASEANRTSLAARLMKSIPPTEANEKWTAEYRGYTVRRRIPGKEEANLLSVQQIEGTVQLLRDQEAALVPPPPGMHTYDLGKYVADQQKMRMTLATTRMPFDNILARIKDRLWEFLTETEHELTFGEATAETFDRLRSYVDRQLTTISAPALEQFQTAYRRLKDGGDEDRAHALTSCRRVLKTLADELYPARSEPVMGSDGKSHVLNDAAFVNLCVPKTSSASCDQAIFVDQASDVGVFPDAVQVEVGGFGQRFQRRAPYRERCGRC